MAKFEEMLAEYRIFGKYFESMGAAVRVELAELLLEISIVSTWNLEK